MNFRLGKVNPAGEEDRKSGGRICLAACVLKKLFMQFFLKSSFC